MNTEHQVYLSSEIHFIVGPFYEGSFSYSVQANNEPLGKQ